MTRPYVVHSLFMFLAVGAVATLMQFGILVSLVQLASLDPVTASAIGYVASAVVNYILNYKFSFRSTEPHARAAVRFVATNGVSLLINSIAIYSLTAYLGVGYVYAQVAATAIVLSFNFTVNRFWTFRSAGVP